MRLFRHYDHLPTEMRGSAVAVGNFDGVHLGHRAVIGTAGRIAQSTGAPWAVLTFDPHPRSLFEPEAAPFRLTPLPAKVRLIESLGPALLVVVRFDATFARMQPRAFVERVLVEGLGARHVVCGHDFAFGHGRKGTPEVLLWMGDEFSFGFTCVSEIRDDAGEAYSSTRIREYLRHGDVEAANRQLGQPFAIEGEVIHGDQRGRTIGFPTANVQLHEYLHPAAGVYAVRATVPEREAGSGLFQAPAIANFGRRPTFDGGAPLLETHVFDYDGDLYGRPMTVEFVSFLRPERTFDGLEHLRAQIVEDCARARGLLRATSTDGSERAIS